MKGRDVSVSSDTSSDSTLQDATFRRQAEEERQAILKCAMESARLESMGLLASGVAHDFNNLLTGVLGNLELAMEDVADRPNTLMLLKNANCAGTRAKELCAQILNQVRRGRREFAPVDLHSLIEDAGSLMGASTKRVRFHFHLAAKPSVVTGAAVELRQILLNLVINSAEAMGDKGGNVHIVTRNLSIRERGVSKLAPGDYVEIVVTDDGPGMPEHVKRRVFEPFFTTKPTGTGIGLAAAVAIMESHRGTIEVESHVGDGTTFTLRVPLAEKAVVAELPLRGRSKGRILVIDDDEFICLMLRRVLTEQGFDVECAESGEAALNYLRAAASPYIAVMLDLNMPKMDGAATLVALRAEGLSAPVVLMTGLPQYSIMHRIAGSDYQMFMIKPFSPDQVISVVRSLADSAQGENSPGRNDSGTFAG